MDTKIKYNKKCPKCKSEEKQYKHGYTKKRKPRYRCMICKAVYSFTEPKYSEEFKKEAVKFYLNGNSSRKVANIYKIGKNTIWNWIKYYKSELLK